MKRSFYVLIALAIILSGYAGLWLSSDWKGWFQVERSAPILEYEVANADRIARIEVEQVAPARLGIDPENPICGNKYFVKVVESLKGNQRPFEFFSSAKLETGHDYLVFVHKQKANAAHFIDELTDLQLPIETKMLACRALSSNLFLPIGRQTYFEFDTDMTKNLGDGEWITSHDSRNALGFTWCNSDWPSNVPVPKSAILRTRSVEIGNTMVRYIAWQSAQQLIRDALKNPPYWWGIIPNPMFRPGAC